MSMDVARKVVEHFRGPPAAPAEPAAEPLTERERELLELLAQGFLYKEIADQLKLSYNTVRTHLNNIYRKLHVQSRAHAALKYRSRHPAR